MNDELKKVYDYVTAQEDKYYDFAFKCLESNNTFANQIHSAEATAFQRVRYFIECMLEDN